jgi:hypothetical protein
MLISRRKPKKRRENPALVLLFHLESHMMSPGIDIMAPSYKPTSNYLSYGMALSYFFQLIVIHNYSTILCSMTYAVYAVPLTLWLYTRKIVYLP